MIEVEQRAVGGLGLVLIGALASGARDRREGGKHHISLTITKSVTGAI
jgi:hypothetical protein